MKTLNLIGLLLCILLLTSFASAQDTSVLNTVKATPAFVLLASYKANVSNELTNLRDRFTETNSTVVSKRAELEITQREMAKILVISKSQQPFLSEAYGELIIRKIKAETVLLDLLRRNTLSNPKVVEAANQLQAIENELTEISS